jgi:hypothetical protein
MFDTKQLAKGPAKKRETFTEICQNCWESNSQLVKFKTLFSQPLVTITNIQKKVYFAYLFFSCWNFEKLNLKLLNLGAFKNS